MSGRTRGIVAALLATAAIVVLVVAFTGDPAPAASASGRVTTPLWSARRVPEPIAGVVGAQHLQQSLDQSFAGDGVCFTVQADGQVVASHDGDAPLIGASTQKLLVGAVALAILGPDFTYVTKVTAPAAPSSGTVDHINLVGSGDPGLVTAPYASYLQSSGLTKDNTVTSLEALADAIVAKGVQRIPNGIVADDTRYDTQRYVPTWSDSYRTGGDIGPLGALTVNGGWSAWQPHKVVVNDPANYAATTLAQLLKARGVQVGPVSDGASPTDAPLIASVTSPSLRDIVASMLRSSDNLSAELLVKELAVHAGKPGTTADGTAVVLAKLASLGVPVQHVTLVDGSGLDRGNRVTCNTLSAVLSLSTRPDLGLLLTGLPVAGQTGTLFDQFLGTPLVGKLKAKTGSLDGVAGFAGTVDVNLPLQFAFIDNGSFPDAAADGLRARLGTILATYPTAPALDALVPPPAAAAAGTAALPADSLHPGGGH
jgi:D-alanyl-D-alanine carboxypeptidase/D-alanyl-D-alanine-endopeptidase (penicillin-binding protein 4)